MPNRILREGILTSERVDAIADTPAVEVTYRRLQSVADDFGRYTAHPKLVRAAIYPLRLEMHTDDDISNQFRRCEEAGLIRLYQVAGKPYLEILDFRQKTRAKRSKYPGPDGTCDVNAPHVQDACMAGAEHMRTETESESEPESEARDGGERRRRDNDSLATPVQMEQFSPRVTPNGIALVKKAITAYMQSEPDDDLVRKVLEAGGGASAEDICAHLAVLWAKGCKPGRSKGPKSFGWFVAVTRQHFNDLRAMEFARLNPNAAVCGNRTDVAAMDAIDFDPMTDAIELGEA
jgi:hypothetical protein